MDSPTEDEGCRFFDAHEDIILSFTLNSDRSDPADSCSAINNFAHGKNPYGVWTRSPVSAKERRSKFLDWMGLALHHNSLENWVSTACFRANASRVGEMSGAVLRTSSDEEFISTRSSISSWRNSSSDVVELSAVETFVPREGDLDGARACNLDVLEDCTTVNGCPAVHLDRKSVGALSEPMSIATPRFRRFTDKEAEKQGKLADIFKKVKKRWFGRLQMKGRLAARQPGNDDGSFVGHKAHRVKVKQYKRQTKELSGLYKVQEITAHEGSILAMKFSPDGQYLASAGEDKIVRVWQVVQDERSDNHDIPEMDASCVYFEVNDLCELKPVLVHKDKSKKMGSVKKNPESACIIFPPKVFRLLEKPLHEFHGHTGEILDISWSRNGCLLSASVDKTVRLWRVGYDHCLGVYPHSNYVTSVQFNPVDENHFISGSIDGKVRIWAISGCRVFEWADVRDIVTAVCYHPHGQAVIIGTMSSSCRFYSITDNHLQLDAQISLHNKKKSYCKRISGFQFFPKDPSKVMVISADYKVRILHGLNVVGKYKGLHAAGNQISASFTSNGEHIISACDDSNVYLWNFSHADEISLSTPKKVQSCERFSIDASVAIPWCGFSKDAPFAPPSWFSLPQEFVLDAKGYATWPEENLPSSPLSSSKIQKSQYKFLRASCQSTTSSHAWGLVIVTAGWDGRIKSFHNYGLPVPV